jgi:hypothetical protein
MGGDREVYKTSVRKHKQKKPVERIRTRWGIILAWILKK